MMVESVDGRREREILTAMIVDPTVAGRISLLWDLFSFKGAFSNEWCNLVGGWCVRFYRKHKKPIGRNVESVFADYAATAKDENTVTLVETFIGSLSEEYARLKKEINPDHVLDVAAKYFKSVKANTLKSEVESLMEAGEIEKAEETILAYKKVEMGIGAGIDPFLDREAVISAFSEKSEPIIQYPAPMQSFLQGALERDAFVAFLAPNKSGKSMWLLDVAYRAMCQRRKVAFFVIGDLSQNQWMRRLAVRAAAHPIHGGKSGWPKTIRVPTDLNILIREIEDDEGRMRKVKVPEVTFQEKTFAAPLSGANAWEACQRVMSNKVKSDKSYFKLAVYPSGSISIAGIQAQLEQWQMNEGFIPDVVGIDYADNLAPISRKLDERASINETWMAMRALSQIHHCLLVTATQADSESFRRGLLDKHNFSGDRRKLDHVTGMIGINQTDDEKAMQIQRLNWVNIREGETSGKEVLWVANCLAIANPVVKCFF